MSTRAFDQYVRMYLAEHPIADVRARQEQVRRIFSTPEDCAILHINDIFPSDSNIVLCVHPEIANGVVEKQHTHDFFELIYLSAGACRQRIGDRDCDLKPGDICLLNPNVSHWVHTEKPGDLLFNIMIKPTLFNEYFLHTLTSSDMIRSFFVKSLYAASSEKSYLYFPKSENTECSRLAENLILELLEQKLGYQTAAENYLALLFTELTRTWKSLMQNGNDTGEEISQITRIIDYVNQNKHEATLKSVAEHFHYHPKYLSSLFKKYTNHTFSEILLDARFEEICYYLKYTELSIDEISAKAGYYDRSHFNRVFKKRFDMTPSGYRLLNKA